jgi:hypothetical protein
MSLCICLFDKELRAVKNGVLPNPNDGGIVYLATSMGRRQPTLDVVPGRYFFCAVVLCCCASHASTSCSDSLPRWGSYPTPKASNMPGQGNALVSWTRQSTEPCQGDTFPRAMAIVQRDAVSRALCRPDRARLSRARLYPQGVALGWLVARPLGVEDLGHAARA